MYIRTQRALAVGVSVNDQNKNKNTYYILSLGSKNGEYFLAQIPFEIYEFDKAIKTYEALEVASDLTSIFPETPYILDDISTMIDSVLVSANSIGALKAAYPNYFIDTSEFVNILREILL